MPYVEDESVRGLVTKVVADVLSKLRETSAATFVTNPRTRLKR